MYEADEVADGFQCMIAFLPKNAAGEINGGLYPHMPMGGEDRSTIENWGRCSSGSR
jgi:hypothetical protein